MADGTPVDDAGPEAPFPARVYVLVLALAALICALLWWLTSAYNIPMSGS